MQWEGSDCLKTALETREKTAQLYATIFFHNTLYKHALALYKLFWSDANSTEFLALNLNTILTSRQVNFITTKDNKRKVGLNALANRLNPLNNRIPLLVLNSVRFRPDV